MGMDRYAPEMEGNHHPVILIDGECHLCQHITRYLVKHDKRAHFRFAALQSRVGQRMLKEAGYSDDWNSLNTFVLLKDGRYATKSGAALRVWRALGGWRSLAFGLILIPAPIRDAVYDLIARNRYRWFGRSDVCLLPTKEIRSRFLEGGFE
ncbi:DCC1-like thiol-disulfide oxidoreductase family protein [Paenibacillus sp. LHD-117]|uniref:thiol-disulfide oxidoreductase DCC family protein n=1 Tax=Paenibacillus sp. LHD-117 TaxID=3071412 RepID=UPI0027DEB755|nr:DCC1-like thiol-disulfide oxidoreductase family protein [Paenibacillus sp. LHD-117]MDQ6418040.1 DCC1-like thiol-disulfide oxidoreductase family protein [Paenibacillus sp. LHD-117]